MTLQEQLNIPQSILDEWEITNQEDHTNWVLIQYPTVGWIVFLRENMPMGFTTIYVLPKQKPVTEDDEGLLAYDPITDSVGVLSGAGFLTYFINGMKVEDVNEIRLATPEDFPQPDKIKEQAKGWLKEEILSALNDAVMEISEEDAKIVLNEFREWLGGAH